MRPFPYPDDQPRLSTSAIYAQTGVSIYADWNSHHLFEHSGVFVLSRRTHILGGRFAASSHFLVQRPRLPPLLVGADLIRRQMGTE